jgi:predicted amidohydrolase YtcJ
MRVVFNCRIWPAWCAGALAVLLTTSCTASRRAPEAPADLIIVGGSVITLDAAQRRAEALAVRDGRLIAVGSEADVRATAGDGTRVVDLGGRAVLPAFHDVHVHPVTAGVELGQCNLNDLLTAEAILEAVRRCVQEQRGRPWLVGGGWALPAFPASGPDRDSLDRITGEQPTTLTSSDGHSMWVNSAALRAASITRDTPDPPAGVIERDARGEPTGVLRESAANLVSRHVPPPTPEEYEAGLRRALAVMNRVGIVSFQEANANAAIVAAYRAVAREGDLTARARLSLSTDAFKDASQVDALVAMRASVVEPGLSAGSAKIFVDGVIEAGTAALLEPYIPLAGAKSVETARGLPNFTDAALAALVTRLDREGFQLHMHAIGDAAVRQALDAVEAATRVNGPRDRRAHLAHVQLVHPSDHARFAELGVVANIQPLWAYADSFITDLTEPRLGPTRSRYLYPFASLQKAGAQLAGGSDWSVTSVNPLHAIQVAVTRKALDAPHADHAWLAEERLDLTAALEAYTRGGAYLNFEESNSGSLELGKFADLVVLDRDPYKVAPHELHALEVHWTLKQGVEVFRASGFRP